MTYRNQLAELLARLDGLIVVLWSHVERPEDDESAERAIKLLVVMERIQDEVEEVLRVEGKLRDT